MKDPEKYAVGLVAMGRIPEIALNIVSAHISGYLNLPSRCLPMLALPPECFDKKRFQYDAAKLIQYLERQAFADCIKIIALAEGDLFLPIFTHVLGEAQQGGTHAVISLSRLQSTENGLKSPDSKFYERIAKVALHELGHLFNLFHCRDTRCLMHFSGTIETLDAISLNYCSYCQRFLEDAHQRMGIVKEHF
ncbi:MAG: hypothetical protein R6V39_04505 [Desulfovibrionales bacterium]